MVQKQEGGDLDLDWDWTAVIRQHQHEISNRTGHGVSEQPFWKIHTYTFILCDFVLYRLVAWHLPKVERNQYSVLLDSQDVKFHVSQDTTNDLMNST